MAARCPRRRGRSAAAPAELLRPSPDPGAVPGTFWKVPRGSSGLPQEFRVVLAELGRSGDQSGDDLRGRPSERLAVSGDHDGCLLPSGGSPSCSRISLQRSVAAPRRSRVALRRSEAVPRRSFRARPRSAVIVCRSAGVPLEGVRRRREAAQLSACSSLLWEPLILKAGAAGAARRSAGLIQSPVSCWETIPGPAAAVPRCSSSVTREILRRIFAETFRPGAAFCPVITLWSPHSTSAGSVSVSV